METNHPLKEKESVETKDQKENKFTDVFLTETNQNGKRYLATWVYSILLLLSLFISIISVPMLSKHGKLIPKENREVKLQLEGSSTVHISVGDYGLERIEISQPKSPTFQISSSKPENTGEYWDKKYNPTHLTQANKDLMDVKEKATNENYEQQRSTSQTNCDTKQKDQWQAQ